jgi:hypothetical protein
MNFQNNRTYSKVIYSKMNGTTNDIINAIHSALPDSIRQTQRFAEMFKCKDEKETCRNIFNFVLYKIKYIADTGTQTIKTPTALLRDKSGDCKSMALFIGSCLSNLDIPYFFTYASYGEKNYSHVYITTQSGIIIDPVYKQFNKEKTPTFKTYKRP